MKKMKGFTLIELLAVIVVMGIIALIASPLILKYIEKAREGAAINSAYTYIDALETHAVASALSNNENVKKNTQYFIKKKSIYSKEVSSIGKFYLKNVIDVKGQYPDDGFTIIDSKNYIVKKAIFLYKDIEVECDENRCFIRGRRNIENEEINGKIWNGYITLTLIYPEGATDKKWRISEPGEVRQEDWKNYEGSVTVPIDQVENIYIRYKLGNEIVIIPPAGVVYVDINPSSFTIKDDQKISVEIYSNADEVYYQVGTEWVKYEGVFEVTKAGVIHAKGISLEDVYNSDGTIAYTRKITEYDSVYIRPYGTNIGSDFSSDNNTNIHNVKFENGKVISTHSPQSPKISYEPRTDLTTSVLVTITPPVKARKIYYKLGNGDFEEYTEPFIVSENKTVRAYYIDDIEGAKSAVAIVYISNIYKEGTTCSFPYLSFKVNPDFSYRYVDSVDVELLYSETDEVYYSYNGVEYFEYNNKITLDSNKRIYGKTVNNCGETVDYIDITNIGKSYATEPPIEQQELNVMIFADPEYVQGEYTKNVEITIEYDEMAEKKYYKVGNGKLEEYKEPFNVNKNTTITAYAISDDGYGVATKNINGIGDENGLNGISGPIITASPKNSTQTNEVEVTIEYAENSISNTYRIGNGNVLSYNGPFKVDKNTTIYAENKDELGNVESAIYEISNIKKKIPLYIIDNGDYFIIKLNYPSSSDPTTREYKFADNDWKEYKTDGILLVLPDSKLNTDGVIKVIDETGKEKVFNGDYYHITCPPSEIFENIEMRWETGTPATPIINVNPEEASREVEVSITYDEASEINEYMIKTSDGKMGEWQTYEGSFKIVNNKITIYARSQNYTGVYSKLGIYTITNIDEVPPQISIGADFLTKTPTLGIRIKVTDDVGIDKVMYAKGLVGPSYFKDKGTEIENSSIVKIIENGTYTFYAKDKVGNTQTYTVEVTNIDNEAPSIIISESPIDKVGLETLISIDFGDSTTKKYKIGAKTSGWTNYTGVINLTSETVVSKKLYNEDFSITICAQGKDDAGNIEEVCKNIYNLDADAPSTPVISAHVGYPILTENGIRFDAYTTIKYDDRNDIDNYYSLDGNNWIKYTGKFEVLGGTIYAKSVKKDTGLEVSTTMTVSIPSDALGFAGYDNDETTSVAVGYKGASYVKLLISSEMQGRNIEMIHSSSSAYIGAQFYNASGTLIRTVNGNESTTTSMYTIPEAAVSVKFLKNKINTNYSTCYIKEIIPATYPKIKYTKKYSTLTENGISVGKSKVSIEYFDTSIKNLYKIDDGEWKIYTKPIDLEYGKTIYAKGILRSGVDSKISSYTSVLPDDALGYTAYDNDETTSYAVGYQSNVTSKLLISNEMKGRVISVTVAASYTNITTFKFYNSDGTELKKYTVESGAVVTKEFVIPEDASYMLVIKPGDYTNCSIYEISSITRPEITYTKNYSTLTENGISVGKSKVSIEYFDTSVKNLYKIDDGEWKVYTKPIDLEYGKTIYAKGILRSGVDSKISSYTSVLPDDALGYTAYDNDVDTSVAIGWEAASYVKLLISKEMQGRNIEMIYSAGGSAIGAQFYDELGNLIKTETTSEKSTTYKYTIPKDTVSVKFIKNKVNTNYTTCYIMEVTPATYPKITYTKNYSTLTENGVSVGKSKVLIEYFDTSIKNLYKIDDGEWQIYTEPVDVEYGKTIYAKGILRSGVDSKITSYKSVLPSDALGYAAYDNDETTSVAIGWEAASYVQLLISSEMQGKKLAMTYSAGGSAIGAQFYDESGALIKTENTTASSGVYQYTIPETAVSVKFIKNKVNTNYTTCYINEVTTGT